MQVAFYIYTLSIMALCVMAASLALAAYFVSHHRGHLYATFASLFYFFDSSLIFLDDYLDLKQGFDATLFYSIPNPFLKTAIATGMLVSIYLILCDFFDEKSVPVIAIPGILFFTVSICVCTLGEVSAARQFGYYSLRQIFLVYLAIFILVKYHRITSKSLKHGMRKYLPLYIVFVVMIVCIFVEDYFNIMVLQFDAQSAFEDFLPYLSERNFCENILAIVFAILGIKRAAGQLSIRYNMTPETEVNHGAAVQMDEKLPTFVKRNGLSKREEEVLRMLLQNKDNQFIASTLGVSLGTVKAHVHHIFTKTNSKSRQDVKENFWSS